MQIHRIATTGTALDFEAAIKRASAVAEELLGENMLLSWYDRERDRESPDHASECHEGGGQSANTSQRMSRHQSRSPGCLALFCPKLQLSRVGL